MLYKVAYDWWSKATYYRERDWHTIYSGSHPLGGELLHPTINLVYDHKCVHRVAARGVMTHKYRGCIVVLSINKSVEPNEEQKVLTSSFDQGFTVNTSKRVFRGIW
jgi:hypothetical protein